MTTPRAQVVTTLRDAGSFLVASHFNPDGDAMGSMAAMGHLLRALGKDVHLYNPTGIPERFAWLEFPGPVQTVFPSDPVDWVITLDCADLDRLGDAFSDVVHRRRIINIDHHLGNPGFGTVNWIEPGRSSVGEMVALLAQDLDIPLTGPVGEGVYLAIVTDTGSFSFGNTTPETLEMVARILRGGLNPGRFNAQMQSQWTLNKIHLQGMALERARVHLAGKVAVVSVNWDMMRRTRTGADDCEGLVNFMRQIKGVLVGVSLREQDDGGTKFSLRSWGDTDVRNVAMRFGGGGHRNASGGHIELGLDQAEERLVKAIAETLELSEG